jgi:hypothetical protein
MYSERNLSQLKFFHHKSPIDWIGNLRICQKSKAKFVGTPYDYGAKHLRRTTFLGKLRAPQIFQKLLSV